MEPIKKKYLGCCGGPIKRICGKWPLRYGVFLIACRDIAISIESLITLVLLYLRIYSPPNSKIFLGLSYLYLLLMTYSSVSTIIAIYGIFKTNKSLIYQFYILLIIKFVIFLAHEICLIIFMPRDEDDRMILEYLRLGFTIPTAIFATRVIWSTYVRLENNEISLVLYGREEIVNCSDEFDPPLLISSDDKHQEMMEA